MWKTFISLTNQTNKMRTVEFTNEQLKRRINDLKEGDFLDLTLTETFGTAGITIQRITPKAILVNEEWIPKSQIVEISYGHFYKSATTGAETNIKSIEHKQIVLNRWWDKKKAKDNWAKRNAPCGY